MRQTGTGRLVLAGWCAVVVLSACDERTATGPQVQNETVASRSAPVRVAPSRARPPGFASADEEFTALAKEMPGKFGGYFYGTNDRLTVYLVDLRQRHAALGVLLPALHRRFPRNPRRGHPDPSSIRFLQGQYDFGELARWRSLVDQNHLRFGGLVTTDVDEARNRVVIGVEDAAAQARARAQLAALGIPGGAVLVEVKERDHPVTTLNDSVPAVAGGYLIQWLTSSGALGGACSLGFNAWRNDPQFGWEQVFVTASHCSNAKFAVDGVNYYQWRTSRTSQIIGYEIVDPPPYSDVICPSSPCRWSDALVALWTSSRWDFGHIARTTGLGNGSVTVDPVQPTFSILSEISYGNVGDLVYRVGRSSGWTSGTITNNCVNAYETGNVLVYCQEEAAFNALGGDSGGPVFSPTVYPGWVDLRGIVWGGRTFSDMYGIERDLGQMDVVNCSTSHPYYPNC